MPVDWDDYRIILAVSRAGSYQGAARLLHVTHTTIGRRIAAIEARTRQPIFLREGATCVPTLVGVRLISAATRIEEEVRRARVEEAASGGPQGLVRIVSVNWVLNEVLLPGVVHLREQYPGIRLQLHGSLDDREEREVSTVIALRFETKPDRGEVAIPIGEIDYAVYAPASRKDFSDLPWVSFGGSLPLAWLERQGVAADEIALTVNDAAAVRAAICAGIGRGLVPVCLIAGHPHLTCLSCDGPETSRTLRAVGRRADLMNEPGATVLNWIADRFASVGCAIADRRSA